MDRGKFTPRPRNDPSYYGGECPFIQTGELSGDRASEIVETDAERTRGSREPEVSCRNGSRGYRSQHRRSALLAFETCFPDSVVGLQARPERARPEFLEVLLRFKKQMLRDEAPETAQKNINGGAAANEGDCASNSAPESVRGDLSIY